MRRLQILVPDKNTEYAARGALERTESLGVKPFSFDIIVHPGRDGGVRSNGPELLRLQRGRFSHALLLVDHEGSGTKEEPLRMEETLDARLAVAWGADAKAIVIEPELEVWMWGADSHLREVCGWTDSQAIRPWLEAKGYRFDPQGKATRPKEALEAVFRFSQVPRSSAQYKALASRLSLGRCHDPAFLRLSATLRRWFAA